MSSWCRQLFLDGRAWPRGTGRNKIDELLMSIHIIELFLSWIDGDSTAIARRRSSAASVAGCTKHAVGQSFHQSLVSWYRDRCGRSTAQIAPSIAVRQLRKPGDVVVVGMGRDDDGDRTISQPVRIVEGA
jgi:hypothetical protein